MTVIGTAGHVDHGKSALVRALTGIDPDRLPEERARGMTIDLGFAWITLPSGREVSIVDVPGHERFIKNMMAGAGGIDLALLIVAADEGPRAQTEEHLAVIELLDVRHMVVALTKSDIVPESRLSEVASQVADRLGATRFAEAPVIATSAMTGEGLSSLRDALDAVLETVPARADFGRPRLPVDRAFHVKGFGTVVTGTLVDGVLRSGDIVEVQPGGLRARVRGLQQHTRTVEVVGAGERAAVNLSGVELDQLARGQVLAAAGTVGPVRAIVTRLTAATTMSAPLRHDAGVTVLVGTAEREARLRLLDTRLFEPGGQAWAELLLSEPVAAVEGDRCLVRTSNDTVAGGPIVALDLPRGRRGAARSLDRLGALLSEDPAARITALAMLAPVPVGALAARLRVGPGQVAEALESLSAEGAITVADEMVFAKTWLDGQASALTRAAGEILARDRMYAVPREQIGAAIGLRPEWLNAVLRFAIASGAVVERGAQGIVPAGHASGLSSREQSQVDAFLAALSDTTFSPGVEAAPLPPRLVRYLSDAGLIEELGNGVMLSPSACRALTATVVEHIRRDGSITLAQARDSFGTSRKYAQALLEHLDGFGVTRRVGDARQLGPRPGHHGRRDEPA